MKKEKFNQSFNTIDKKTGRRPFEDREERHVEYEINLYENFGEIENENEAVKKGVIQILNKNRLNYKKFFDIEQESDIVKSFTVDFVNKTIIKKLNSISYMMLKENETLESIQAAALNYKLTPSIGRQKRTPIEKARNIIDILCVEDQMLMLKHLESVLGTPVEFFDRDIQKAVDKKIKEQIKKQKSK